MEDGKNEAQYKESYIVLPLRRLPITTVHTYELTQALYFLLWITDTSNNRTTNNLTMSSNNLQGYPIYIWLC